MQYANTVPLPSRRKPIFIQYIKWDQIEDRGWKHIWTQDLNKSSKSNDYKILLLRLSLYDLLLVISMIYRI